MTRLTTILLTLAIALANAICLCASPLAKRSFAPPPRSCHATKVHKTSDHQDRRAPSECGHCSGIAAADTSIARTVAPPMTLLDSIFVAQYWPAISYTPTTPFASLDHSGLPPPARGRTLLDLACSLTT
ncbi:MAG: hypothetical protein H7Z14_18590 [Anaerolineae bacterium]|nr:hypothetical protein [Phycisphaerae bacterium]